MTDEHDIIPSNDDIFIADVDEFDDNLDAQLPAWPKVIGIISIVWGSLGVVCNGFGVASALLMPMMMGAAADQMEGGMPDIAMNPPLSQMLASVFGFFIAILLIIAGALTVMRKASGRKIHLIYAPINILLLIWAILMQLDVQSQIADWVAANPDSDFARQQQMGGSALGLIMVFVFSVIFLIWPVFTLVWFGAIKKTHEDMTGGVDLDVI